mmetsp:Transcript_44564/g.53496  ORF Transcript_44564/g.53496 Transcript_44564/m.53496 type:complete len:246 (-) Transcript_44564:452-1189(-)
MVIDPEVVEDREDPDPEVDRVDRVHQTPRVVDREAHHILAAHREAVDHRTLHPQLAEDPEAVNHQTLGVGPVEHRNPAVVDPEVHRNWVGVDPEEEDLVVHRNPAVVDPEVHRNWVGVDPEEEDPVGLVEHRIPAVDPEVHRKRVAVDPVRVGVLPWVRVVVHPYPPWEVRVVVVPPYPEHGELHTHREDPVVRADPAPWASWPWAAAPAPDPPQEVHRVPSWACHLVPSAHHGLQLVHHSCTIP